MENVSGKEWHYESLALPQVGHMSLPDIAEPITLEEFLQAACHRCDNVKSTATLFDVHSKVSCSGIPSRQDDVNKDQRSMCLTGRFQSFVFDVPKLRVFVVEK